MNKWVPAIIGTVIGIVFGVYSLFQTVESTPALLRGPVELLSFLMRDIFMPNADPMAAFIFQIILMPLLPGILGGSIGYLIGWIWSEMRK